MCQLENARVKNRYAGRSTVNAIMLDLSVQKSVNAVIVIMANQKLILLLIPGWKLKSMLDHYYHNIHNINHIHEHYPFPCCSWPRKEI